MKIFNYREKALEKNIRWLIQGPHFDMRLIEIEPFETLHEIPHVHPWEHEVFVIDGVGSVFDGHGKQRLTKEDVLYIPENEPHTFKNEGGKTLRFICCIPAGVDMNLITNAQE
jgi:quercetin dioxygenase-like cupin family protein